MDTFSIIVDQWHTLCGVTNLQTTGRASTFFIVGLCVRSVALVTNMHMAPHNDLYSMVCNATIAAVPRYSAVGPIISRLHQIAYASTKSHRQLITSTNATSCSLVATNYARTSLPVVRQAGRCVPGVLSQQLSHGCGPPCLMVHT